MVVITEVVGKHLVKDPFGGDVASILEALAEIKALAALPPAADPPQSGKQAPAADPPETIRRQPSRRKRTRRAGDAPA